MIFTRTSLGHLKIYHRITLTRDQSYSIVEMLIKAIAASPEFDLDSSLRVFVFDPSVNSRKERSLRKLIKENEVYRSLDRKTKKFAMDFCIENNLFYFTLMKDAFLWDAFDVKKGEVTDELVYLFYETGLLRFGTMINPIDVPRAWEVTLLNDEIA